MDYQRVAVRVGDSPTILVAVADTPGKRAQGLRGRQLMAEQGMLFVFPQPTLVSMTMRGVDYPLDLLFFDVFGVLQGVVTAPAQSAGPYGGSRASKYMLEVPAGWAAQHGVALGDRLERFG